MITVPSAREKLQISLIGSLISTRGVNSLILLIPYKTDIWYVGNCHSPKFPSHCSHPSGHCFTSRAAGGLNKSLFLSSGPTCSHMAARKPLALPPAHVYPQRPARALTGTRWSSCSSSRAAQLHPDAQPVPGSFAGHRYGIHGKLGDFAANSLLALAKMNRSFSRPAWSL